MGKEKCTFRQKWFPTLDDADELRNERYDRKGKDYDSSSLAVIDFLEDG